METISGDRKIVALSVTVAGDVTPPFSRRPLNPKLPLFRRYQVSFKASFGKNHEM